MVTNAIVYSMVALELMERMRQNPFESTSKALLTIDNIATYAVVCLLFSFSCRQKKKKQHQNKGISFCFRNVLVCNLHSVLFQNFIETVRATSLFHMNVYSGTCQFRFYNVRDVYSTSHELKKMWKENDLIKLMTRCLLKRVNRALVNASSIVQKKNKKF